MAKKQAEAAPQVRFARGEGERDLVEQLGMDPESDAARWVRQQQEAGVKNVDILFSLANAESVAPARTRRVPVDA